MMDQKMIENIKNYDKKIKNLGTFVEAVRKVPGMYIGHIGNRGYLNMFREIFQNSIDQIMRKDSPGSWVKVIYDERDHTVINEDNGLGIPFNKMIEMFTQPHTGSNFEKGEGQFVSGLHGIGSKVTNALCSYFKVESYRLGEAMVAEFRDGVPTKESPYSIPNKENKQGTRITFRPAYDVLGEITLSGRTILNLIKMIVSLTILGTEVDFTWIKPDGTIYEEKIINTEGILYDIICKTKKPLIAPIMISHTSPDKKADIAFTFDSDDLSEEDITAFSNFCPTKLGTHITGFLDGVCKFFKDYMNKIYLNKNSKLTITSNDVKTGLKAIISVSHLTPIFSGQAKDELSNEDMEPYVRDVVISSLQEWAQTNPNDLQKVAKYLKEIAEIRVKSEEGKVKLSNNYRSSSISGLPADYVKPNGKKDLELLIVEGKSAKGSASSARCNNRQGIFPIRGKLPNAFTTSPKEFLNNAEVSAIINICGGTYGKNFDINKCKFQKIISMTDADADGAHIHTLVLSLFLVYMTPIIIHGRLYKAVPPLYGIKTKNGTIYFTDKIDYIQYMQQRFSKNNQISTVSGITLTNSDTVSLLYRNIDYTYELETIANTYALNPELLELVLIYRNSSFDEIKKIIEKKFRFMQVEKKNNMIVITGLINSKFQTLFLNERLIEDSKYIINHIDNINKGIMFYNLNGNTVSLYAILKEFEKTGSGEDITRYKGLGEMNPLELRESGLHPDYNRTLIQYTIDDVKKEIAMMRNIQDNKAQLITNLQVSRQEIIG